MIYCIILIFSTFTYLLFVNDTLCVKKQKSKKMSIEIHPQSINPAPINDGLEAVHNRNCAKKAAR